jgi:hypothetical protein
MRALLEQTRVERASLGAMLEQARDEATSDQTRAEGKYDTRATEASYLVAGQGQRLMELTRIEAILETADAGPGYPHLYEVEGRNGVSWYLLLAEGGGQRAWADGAEVVVVTPQSPLGQALAGAEPGDSVWLGSGSARAECAVLSVI